MACFLEHGFGAVGLLTFLQSEESLRRHEKNTCVSCRSANDLILWETLCTYGMHAKRDARGLLLGCVPEAWAIIMRFNRVSSKSFG